jgi:Flp pilus assembly protein TadG
MLELALFAPWVFMLFIGAFDWGFYNYALISQQAATRSAALHARTALAEASNSDAACTIVRNEMKSLPNVANLTSCTALPLIVTAAQIPGPDGVPAAKVSVTYRSLSLVPIPGLLDKQFTITRIVTMRI